MAIDLFKHNQKAYESAVALLNETGKAAIIHPTGTGKSFIGFKLCEEHPFAPTLWISPSEYIFQTQKENLTKTGADFPANIGFYTYAKLAMLSDEEIFSLKPAYIILDEFHRAGARVWGQGVARLLKAYPKAQVLGLSATNIRYLDNQRDMADELFAGNVASEMTLGEAIVRGILQAPTYITSIWSYRQDYQKLQRRVSRAKNQAVRDEATKTLEKLRRALENSEGLDHVFAKHIKDKSGKYLVFCANLNHLNRMKAQVKEWFQAVDPKPHVYTAYADDPTTNKEFQAFKADASEHLKLLFCIDMLNEGVHVEDVSGVILFRPTVSPIIYKQQIGRALSASGSKEPVIFDIVNNIENLWSIDALKEEMATALQIYRENGDDSEILCERFQLFDEVREARLLFDNLNQILTASWNIMYEKAKRYRLKHGNLNIPRRYKTVEGYSLGSWIQTQRKVYAGLQYGQLDQNRIRRLEAIGMVWDVRGESWDRLYKAAQTYVKDHGDFNIKADYVTLDGLRLGSWVCNLRALRKGQVGGHLSRERIEALDKLGMIWDAPNHVWEEHFAACAEYYREHGNLDMPFNYVSPKGLKLGSWLQYQRLAKLGVSRGRISDEQVKRLESIGMRWETKYERAWETSYAAAVEYYEAHHNLEVPLAYVSSTGVKLGKWISHQRNKGKENITPYRCEKLDAIGMIWEKPDPWEVRYRLAANYYAKHQNLRPPADYKSEGMWLGKWLNEQRQIYSGNRPGKTLSHSQIRRLESVGMTWGKNS